MQSEIFNETFRDKLIIKNKLFNFHKKPCKGGLFDEDIFGKMDEKRAYEYSENAKKSKKLCCLDKNFGYYKLCMPVYMNKDGKASDIKPSKGVILKILPAMFRPYLRLDNGQNLVNGLNVAYSAIIDADKALKKRIKKNIKVTDLPEFFFYYKYLQGQVDLLFEQLYSMYKASFSEDEIISEEDKSATNTIILKAMNLISLSDCGKAYKAIESKLDSIEEQGKITIDNITEKIPDSLHNMMKNVMDNYAYLMNGSFEYMLEALYYGYCDFSEQEDEKFMQDIDEKSTFDELLNDTSNQYLTECPFEEFN